MLFYNDSHGPPYSGYAIIRKRFNCYWPKWLSIMHFKHREFIYKPFDTFHFFGHPKHTLQFSLGRTYLWVTNLQWHINTTSSVNLWSLGKIIGYLALLSRSGLSSLPLYTNSLSWQAIFKFSFTFGKSRLFTRWVCASNIHRFWATAISAALSGSCGTKLRFLLFLILSKNLRTKAVTLRNLLNELNLLW